MLEKMTITVDQSLPAFEQLPSVFAVELSDIAAISLSGEEQNKYLQSQVTCDVNSIEEKMLLNGSHCDAKGKVFSAFRLIMRDGANLLIQPKATLEPSLAELKKFGVFAKVTIEAANNLTYLAVCGEEAEATLTQHFSSLPSASKPAIEEGSTTIVYIEGKVPRYLIIDDELSLNKLADQLNVITYKHAVWELLEIVEGYPVLNSDTISAYVPQMLNLQALNAISFTKGCYLGQETVARMQYLGKNKRALYSLKGQADSAINSTNIIEKQLGDNWRKAGELLTTYTADNGQYYLQAVLSSDTDETINLRIKDVTSSSLTLQTLPYSLTNQD